MLFWMVSVLSTNDNAVGDGGSTNVTLLFPKKDMSAVVGEVYKTLLIVCVFIVTIRFAEVLAKESPPILVTNVGIIMAVKLLQYLKTFAPIVVTEVGIYMAVKPVQLSKRYQPIVVTELPITTDFKPVQLLKTELAVDVTVLPITTDVKPVQPKKARRPRLVTVYCCTPTLSGMVIAPLRPVPAVVPLPLVEVPSPIVALLPLNVYLHVIPSAVVYVRTDIII
jgi:hypothetical protein